jgi:LytS/YehU family sensor histidine kinase
MALRSVMSPHFIFNVLNAIQYYIAKNDRLNAINYLSTFSKLVRSILTHSVSNKITLAEEIEMLKNYISLEMLRFENKFDFNIEVIDQVDIDNIEIPSLLIQPYVENAILHGLYNKNEKGTLSIRIKEEDEVVIFEIEDDGVGREVATKLRQQNFPSHKSMGVKLTEERLKLINSQNLADFEIEDLVDARGPSGTRVTIRITL